jgi:hypothetical protein
LPHAFNGGQLTPSLRRGRHIMRSSAVEQHGIPSVKVELRTLQGGIHFQIELPTSAITDSDTFVCLLFTSNRAPQNVIPRLQCTLHNSSCVRTCFPCLFLLCGYAFGKTQQGTTAKGFRCNMHVWTRGSVASSGCKPTMRLARDHASDVAGFEGNDSSNQHCMCLKTGSGLLPNSVAIFFRMLKYLARRLDHVPSMGRGSTTVVDKSRLESSKLYRTRARKKQSNRGDTREK